MIIDEEEQEQEVSQQNPYYSSNSQLRIQHRVPVSKAFEIEQLKEQYHTYLEDIKTLHICVTCHNKFQPLSNFENYYCNIHLGYLTEYNIWSCCFGPRSYLGCIPSIHFKQQSSILEIYKNPLKVLNVPSILVDNNIISINRTIFEGEIKSKDSLDDCYQMYCLKQF